MDVYLDEMTIAPPLTVDNFEGIAVVPRSPDGIRIYLASDDNGSAAQRTYLLAFDWQPLRHTMIAISSSYFSRASDCNHDLALALGTACQLRDSSFLITLIVDGAFHDGGGCPIQGMASRAASTTSARRRSTMTSPSPAVSAREEQLCAQVARSSRRSIPRPHAGQSLPSGRPVAFPERGRDSNRILRD